MTRLAAALALVVAFAGCATPLTPREEGALIGAGVGAATGAIIGDAIQGSRGPGVEREPRYEHEQSYEKHGHRERHDDD